MDLNIADYFVVGLVLLSTLIAIYRGFVREVITILVWIIAGWFAFVFGNAAGEIFVFTNSNVIKEMLGMVAVFFTIVVVSMGLKFLVFRAFSIGSPTRLDRLAGGLFGFTRGMLVIMAVLWLAPENTIKQPWYTESMLVPKIKIASNVVTSAIPESWKKDLNKNLDNDLKMFGMQR